MSEVYYGSLNSGSLVMLVKVDVIAPVDFHTRKIAIICVQKVGR